MELPANTKTVSGEDFKQPVTFEVFGFHIQVRLGCNLGQHMGAGTTLCVVCGE